MKSVMMACNLFSLNMCTYWHIWYQARAWFTEKALYFLRQDTEIPSVCFPIYKSGILWDLNERIYMQHEHDEEVFRSRCWRTIGENSLSNFEIQGKCLRNSVRSRNQEDTVRGLFFFFFFVFFRNSTKTYIDDSEDAKLSTHSREESQTLCLKELEAEKANSELTKLCWNSWSKTYIRNSVTLG